MRNPLYNKIKSIAVKNMQHGNINNSAFDGIRNRASVKAVMLHLGYIPDNQIKPASWRLPSRQIETSYLVKEMRTKTGQKILGELIKNSVIDTTGLDMSNQYLRSIIYEAREIGFSIEAVKTNGKTTGYKLQA